MFRRFALPGLIFAALTAPTMVQAAAPAAPAPAPQATPLGGPTVAGVCLLSREAVFANAKVGIAASARLKQLSDQAQAEVDAARAPVEADAQAYQQQMASLTPEQRQARELTLQTRLQPIQARADLLNSEIEVTRAKAMQRISDEAQPVIASVYKSKNCGLLMDRNALLGGNFSNDLTAAVVTALDAKISSITFDRETLSAAPATTAPAR